MTRVLCGIPCGGSIKARTVASVIANLSTPGASVDVLPVEGALGPENRNALAAEAVGSDYDYLWLVDADNRFPGNTLARLLAHDADIVGAAYNRRALPLQTVVRIEDGKGGVGVPTGPLPDELFACYAIGSGCQLIATAALRRIPKPWFSTDYSETGAFIDDAVWFGRQARAAGIQVLCDPTIRCTHIGDYEY